MSRDDAYRLVQEAAQDRLGRRDPIRRAAGEGAPDLEIASALDPSAYLAHVPEVMARLQAFDG